MKLSARSAGIVVLAAIEVLLVFSQSGTACASVRLGNVEKLLPARTAICWYDADILDDLALNARGKITFLYVDGKLSGALARLKEEQMKNGPVFEIPPQLFAYSNKYNSRKKHVVFVARVEAMKIWEFDSGKISVGGYIPSEKDIIRGVSANPNAELRHGTVTLPKNYHGYIGFFVPVENVKPGTEVKLEYGEYFTDWLVPSKNQ
ncbi:MAG: hypothetical protein LBS53_02305 [Synergistaceae bacterium]|jgi:hypothetical protein|nr:hypothetical protein [Synergistaceae bacterium]